MLRSIPVRAAGQGVWLVLLATLTHGCGRTVMMVTLAALVCLGVVPAPVVLWFCMGLVCAAVCLRVTRPEQFSDALQASGSSALSLLTGAPRSEAASLLLLPPSHSGLMHLAMLDRDWLSVGGSLLFGSPGKGNRLREHDLAQLKTHVHSVDCKHCSLGIGRFSYASRPAALPAAAAAGSAAGNAEVSGLAAAAAGAGSAAATAAAAAAGGSVGSPRHCPPGAQQQQQAATVTGALVYLPHQQQQQHLHWQQAGRQRPQQLWDSAAQGMASFVAARPAGAQLTAAAPAWVASSWSPPAFEAPVSAAPSSSADRMQWLPLGYRHADGRAAGIAGSCPLAQQTTEISVANDSSDGAADSGSSGHLAWGSTAAAASASAAAPPFSSSGSSSSSTPGHASFGSSSGGARSSAAIVTVGSVGAVGAWPAAPAGSAAAAAAGSPRKPAAGAAANRLAAQWLGSAGASSGLAAFQAHHSSLCQSSFHKSLMQAWGSYSSLDGLEDCNVCSICLDSYYAGVLVTGLPCGHFYHKECVMPWLLQQGRQSTCPMCKSEVFA